MAQAFGIAPRSPYLDHRVVEYTVAIPPSVRMRALTRKHVLEQVARRHLPSDLLLSERRVLPAPFAGELFMDRGSVLVNELLSPSEVKRAGYFRPAYVTGLLERYRHDRDPTRRAALYFLLERVLIIQGIHHLFIRRRWWASAAATLWRELRTSLAVGRSN